MRKRNRREIMVFSISFLDVIASALGAILILFIIQFNKTVEAKVEVDNSEKRHTQCTQVLEHIYSKSNPQNITDIVVSNFTTDDVKFDPYTEKGTATKPNTPNNNFIDPKIKKDVKPTKKIKLVHKDKIPKKKIDINTPQINKNKIEKRNVPAHIKPVNKIEKDYKKIKTDDDENKNKKIKDPLKTVDSTKLKIKNDKNKTLKKNENLEKNKKTKENINKVKVKLKKVKVKKKKPKKIKLPPKPKGNVLATCITSRKSVVVTFYDHDEPDGDTIMVTFNGKYSTKLKLKKKPTKTFKFKLMDKKYNIISIKNLSNGFYPINTANVYISGCGTAKWKIKKVGVTRVIYIYKK